MKFFCNGTDLSDAILKVIRAMPIKKNIPILEGIKISAIGRELVLTATDMALSIEARVKADILVEGEIVVPGKDVSDVIKKLTNENLELDATEGNTLIVRYGDNSFKVQLMSLDEFPPVRGVAEEMSFKMMAKDFKDMVRKTIFAIATDDIRPILKGCSLEVNGDKITSCALDGFRMAMCNKPLTCECGEFKVIVPARSLDEIVKIMDDEGNITVNLQKNYMMVDLGHTKITTRLIDGDFIDYKRIIPAEYSVYVTVSAEQLLIALERVSQVARGGKNNLVKMDIKERVMNITSASDISDINENVTIALSGKDMKIAFNVRYYLEMLNTINEEFIKISFTSSSSPCIITPVDGDDYLYLVLPVKMTY